MQIKNVIKTIKIYLKILIHKFQFRPIQMINQKRRNLKINLNYELHKI